MYLILYMFEYIFEGGNQKALVFVYKKLCIYSDMFKLQSPSRCSAFDAVHTPGWFSTAQNSFLDCQF